MTIDKSTWLRVADQVARIEHEEAIYLLPVSMSRIASEVTRLSGTACFLWLSVEGSGGCSVSELEGRALERFYTEDSGTVSAAVADWAESMEARGLLIAENDKALRPARISGLWDGVKVPEDLPAGSEMTTNEWALMIHAFAHGVAEAEHIRALSIKGPVLEHYGLRAPRPMSDADVWVEKSQLDRFERTLEFLGLEQRYDRGERQSRVIPAHSVSYFRPDWLVSLDVHWWFPGLQVDEGFAFERLWESREQLDVAGVTVSIPSLRDSAVIQMLHCVREPESARRRSELANTMHIIGGWSPEDRDWLAERLIEFRACDPLRDVLQEAGIDGLPMQWTGDERRRWKVDAATHLDGSTGSILYELMNSPWSKKPKILWDGMWPRDAELIATDLEHRTSKSYLFGARLRRWGKGLRAVPAAVRALIENR